MAALTPASPSDLPPLGELVADDPFWRYPSGTPDREDVAHLRVWLTASPEPGHLAVVTETGLAASVTESAGDIWTELARRYGPSLVLLEHNPAPKAGEGGESLDLVRIGADGSPHWSRAWPTPEENPRHAGLELWMAAHGHQIVSRPASAFDWCQERGRPTAAMAGVRLVELLAASRTRAVLLNPWAPSHGIWPWEFGRHHAGLSVHGASPGTTPGAADASDRLGDCEAGVHLGYRRQGRGPGLVVVAELVVRLFRELLRDAVMIGACHRCSTWLVPVLV